MSVEILLVIAFILLPLIQQLLRAAREREQGQPTQPGGPPTRARRPASPLRRAPSQVARPHTPAVPPPPVPATLSHETMTVPAHAATRRSAETGGPAPKARRRMRQRESIPVGLRSPRNLRDAIVLMTILGPCRALAQDE